MKCRIKVNLKIIYSFLLLLILLYLYNISKIIMTTSSSSSSGQPQEVEEIQFEEDFQKITDVPEKLYLYSAYFDHIDNSIKIIGGGKENSTIPGYCQFYNYKQQYISNSHQLGQIVDLEKTKSPNPYKYKVVWVRCPLQCNDVQFPKYVSITLDPHPSNRLSSNSQNLFKIKLNSITGSSSLNFSLCAGPTFSYDSPLRFLEWIEFYKLMGVDHFIITNVSIGPKTSCLMRQYQLNEAESDVGIEILKWSLVFDVDIDVYMYAIHIQNNECVYRARGLSKYVISVDLDEMIVPSNPSHVSNYMDLLELIEKEKPRDVGQVSAYLFTNGFFVTGNTNVNTTLNLSLHVDDLELEAQIYSNLLLASKIQRGQELISKRSKYIGNPYLINTSFVHWAKESQPGTDNYAVPPELAILQHYRTETQAKFKASQQAQVVDKSGQRLAKQVSVNVAKMLRKYGKSCKIL